MMRTGRIQGKDGEWIDCTVFEPDPNYVPPVYSWFERTMRRISDVKRSVSTDAISLTAIALAVLALVIQLWLLR